MSAGKNKKPAFAIDAILFDLIVLVFFLLFVIISFDYNPRARSIPLGLGIVGSIMMLLQLLVDLLPAVRSKLRFISSAGLLADDKRLPSDGTGSSKSKAAIQDEDIEPPPDKQDSSAVVWWRILRITLWLIGFIILLAFTNYLVAVAAFIVLVTRLEAKESWLRAIMLSVGVDLGFFILFDVVLQAQL